MVREDSTFAEIWIGDEINAQLRQINALMEGVAREEFTRAVFEHAIDRRMNLPVLDKLSNDMTAEERWRTDRYLQFLECCGGPFVNGERISSFAFLIYVELIPDDDFGQIRSEAELSSWIERLQTMDRCGILEADEMAAARNRVQQLVRRRILCTDAESNDWFASFRYLAERRG